MSISTDKEYLLANQYHNASNLNARILLHERFSTNAYSWHPWVFDHLALAGDNRVLELGCGAATLWVENHGRIPPGCQFTLSDLSPGMLAQARSNLSGAAPDFPIHNFHFEVIDAHAIPYVNDTFDVVIANHMLHHVPEPPRVIAEIRRVLKSGGTFYTTTTGDAHLRELWQLVRRLAPELSVEVAGRMTFTLENGATQLAPSFTNIEVRRYQDGLVVTEAAPLADYLFSSFRDRGLSSEEKAAFIDSLEQELRSRGGQIEITKDSGLFIAS